MRSITRSSGVAAMSSLARVMLSAQSHAAGDADRLTGDIARLIGGQEQGCGGNLVGVTQPPQQSNIRHGVENFVATLRYGPFEHRGSDRSGRDRISGDSITRILARDAFCKGNNAALRRGIDGAAFGPQPRGFG